MKNTASKGTKYGFDNDKYLKIQSEHIKERIANSSTIFMPAVCCPVLSPTVS